jgi:hypothetical protein
MSANIERRFSHKGYRNSTEAGGKRGRGCARIFSRHRVIKIMGEPLDWFSRDFDDPKINKAWAGKKHPGPSV